MTNRGRPPWGAKVDEVPMGAAALNGSGATTIVAVGQTSIDAPIARVLAGGTRVKGFPGNTENAST